MSDARPDESEAGPPVRDRMAEDVDAAVSLTGHFYRGEMERVTTWRSRLDQTTNWAVAIMAAILTWAFSSPENPHYVLLIGSLAVGVFMIIEAQRYQEYDAWRSRVRMLQQDLLADVYRREGPEHANWRTLLSRDLREPTVHISRWRAVGHRLQRVYLPLLTVMLAAWTLRITVFETDTPWYASAAIADVPGPVVVAIVGTSYLLLVGLTIRSVLASGKREFDPETATGITRTEE